VAGLESVTYKLLLTISIHRPFHINSLPFEYIHLKSKIHSSRDWEFDILSFVKLAPLIYPTMIIPSPVTHARI